MNNYKIIKKIGNGAFGQVFQAEHNDSSQPLAIKTLKAKYAPWPYALQLPEIKALIKLKHPNIITLKEIFQVGEQLSMVFQFIEGTLYDHLLKDQKTRPSEQSIKRIIKQLAQALSFMHRTGFFHRDLKPQNILYSPDTQDVKICDFGLVRQVRSAPPYTQYVSTRWYRAPELVLRMVTYNSPVDVFALGCIMAQLYTGTPIFPGASQTEQLYKLFKILGTPNSNQWPQMYKWATSRNITIPFLQGQGIQKLFKNASPSALDLMRQMLRPCPKTRITSQNILKHEFFKEEDHQKSCQQFMTTQTESRKDSTSNLFQTSVLNLKNLNQIHQPIKKLQLSTLLKEVQFKNTRDGEKLLSRRERKSEDISKLQMNYSGKKMNQLRCTIDFNQNSKQNTKNRNPKLENNKIKKQNSDSLFLNHCFILNKLDEKKSNKMDLGSRLYF